MKFLAASLAIGASALFALFGFTACMSALEEREQRPTPTVSAEPTEEPTDEPTSAPTVGDPSGEPAPRVHYSNCDEVRQAGAAPITRGEPGYSPDLDREGDGVACE